MSQFFIRVSLNPEVNPGWLAGSLTRNNSGLAIEAIDGIFPKNDASVGPRELIIYPQEFSPSQDSQINSVVQALWRLGISDVRIGRTERVWPLLPPEEPLNQGDLEFIVQWLRNY